VVGKVFPALRLLLGGADEVLDVVEVDLAQIRTPGGHRLAVEQRQPLEAGLEHPLRLALESRDVAHDVLREAAARAGSGGISVVPAELVHPQPIEFRAVDQHIRHDSLSSIWAQTVSSAPAHRFPVESSGKGCRSWALIFGAGLAPKLSVRDLALCAPLITIPILQVPPRERAAPACRFREPEAP